MIEIRFTGDAQDVLREMKYFTTGGVDPKTLLMAMQLQQAQNQPQQIAPPEPEKPEAQQPAPAAEPEKAEAPKPRGRGRPPKAEAAQPVAEQVPEDVRMETTTPLEQLIADKTAATNAGDNVTESVAQPEPEKAAAPSGEVDELDLRVAAYRLLNACGPKSVAAVFEACGVTQPHLNNLPKDQRLNFLSRAKQALEEYLATIDGGSKVELLERLKGVEAKVRGSK